MSTLEAQVAAEQAAHDEAAAPAGQDAAEGKLFDVPRVKVQIDTTDPSVLKVAFSGSVEIDRGAASDVDFYNSLEAGESALLEVDVYVAGAKTSHRRDSDGSVDAVVQTKSLVVTDLRIP